MSWNMGSLHDTAHAAQIKMKQKHNETCANIQEGGLNCLGEGFGTSKLSGEGVQNCASGFLLYFKHLFNHFILIFFWSHASKHSDTGFFVIIHFLSDIPNI